MEPVLKNCPHRTDGWCLDCVSSLCTKYGRVLEFLKSTNNNLVSVCEDISRLEQIDYSYSVFQDESGTFKQLTKPTKDLQSLLGVTWENNCYITRFPTNSIPVFSPIFKWNPTIGWIKI